MELLSKYEIVLSLGEAHYFIPCLLPSNLEHSPVNTNAPVNVRISNDADTSKVQNLECEDDDSSDDEDNREYVNLMVDRAKLLVDDNQCLLAKTSKSRTNVTSDMPSNYKLPAASANSDQLSTQPDFFNFDLLASHSFENSTDLFSTYKCIEDSYITMDNETNVTCYVALCRIWLSPFIPKSFWFRLASRIISATAITKILLNLVPTIDSNSMKDADFSLWSLWQSGIAIIHAGITFLELKCEDTNEEIVDHHKRHKIFLSISVPELIIHHQKLNFIDSNISLSSKDVSSQATKLLVLIEQLILEIGEWFPKILMEDESGGMMSYVPCCFCLQKKKVLKQFNTPEDNCTIINYNHQSLYCFSFIDLLSSHCNGKKIMCPRHGKVSVQHCAPDIVSHSSSLIIDY